MLNFNFTNFQKIPQKYPDKKTNKNVSVMQSVTIRPAHFKTRHGKILKVVRENYLRNDVEHGLGSKLCQESAEQTPSNTLNCTTNACLIVVDTNVVLNQIDILESECIKNIILPQTTLREVKHRSLSIYKRVQGDFLEMS